MKKTISFVFVVLITWVGWGQITEGLTSKTDANGLSYFTSSTDPLKTRIYEFENGLTLYLSDYKATPRIQTYVAIRTGSANDPADNTGLAHYLEHILFKGTSKIGTKNWQAERPFLEQIEQLYETYRTIPLADTMARKAHYALIDSISYLASEFSIGNEYDKLVSSIGADGTNAYTWFDQTVYVNNIPSNQVEKWAKIEAERFLEVTPRLFHTELEAVYEEKNRGLDNDNRRVWEEVFAGLFPNHPYGTQTTIGTVEHLKNPSITAIKAYFDQYYVANNMAICMAGDLEMDSTALAIREAFKHLKKQNLPTTLTSSHEPLKEIVEKNVYGPSSESVTLAFPFQGASTSDALMMELVSMVLSNSQAGLIDLNLNQTQKVLGAYSYPLRLNERSLHILSASPKGDQTLQEVTSLLLDQLELIAKGDFPDWLLGAIITDYKLNQTMESESIKSRANTYVTNFIRNEPYLKTITEIERLETLSKSDLVDFVQKHYGNNYVRINKIKGVDPSIQKVSKPQITPVRLNREAQSEFLKQIIQTEVPRIQPVFVDYQKDIVKKSIKVNHQTIELVYNQNVENDLFDLYYLFDFGSENDKELTLALGYMQNLGCAGYTASELSQAFYKLGCSFNISTSSNRIYLSLSGLNENFQEANELFETFVSTAHPDPEAYQELVSSIIQSRANSKTEKSTLLNSAMVNYAKYGNQSSFKDVISNEALKNTSPQKLISRATKIFSYPHQALYYGPLGVSELESTLQKQHRPGTELLKAPKKKPFKAQKIKENKVYFVEYDMVQAELIMLSKSKKYSKKRAIEAQLFNEYFGGNMGSIVFQEMRESKALAYSVKSYYQTPSELQKPAYTVSYIGTQSDKLVEAINGIRELQNTLILEPASFGNARESLLNSIETSRSIKSGLLFNYLTAQKMKQKKDIKKELYQYIQQADLKDIKRFHRKHFQNKKHTYLVIGSEQNINLKDLEPYGTVQKLELSDLFGY